MSDTFDADPSDFEVSEAIDKLVELAAYDAAREDDEKRATLDALHAPPTVWDPKVHGDAGTPPVRPHDEVRKVSWRPLMRWRVERRPPVTEYHVIPPPDDPPPDPTAA
jgi:hypothetical protein